MNLSISSMTVRERGARPRARGPAEIHQECKDLADLSQEAFVVLTLSTRNHIIGRHLASLGTINSTQITPREVYRPAIHDSATSVVLVHNHPSGDPTPSTDDLRITRQLVEAGKLVGIQVQDHVIIGRDGGDGKAYVSLREQGLVQF